MKSSVLNDVVPSSLTPKTLTYIDSLDIMQHEFLNDEVNIYEDRIIGIETAGKIGEPSNRNMQLSVVSVDSLDDLQHQMLAEEIHYQEDKITPM